MAEAHDIPNDCKVPKECKSYLIEMREILSKKYDEVTKKEWIKLHAFGNVIGVVNLRGNYREYISNLEDI